MLRFSVLKLFKNGQRLSFKNLYVQFSASVNNQTQPKKLKHFHIESFHKHKQFGDTENNFAYSVIKNNPLLINNTFVYRTDNFKPITHSEDFNKLLNQNWRAKSASEIVGAFKCVAEFCSCNNVTLSDIRFDKLVDGLMDRVLDLTDNELYEVLLCLIQFPPCENFDSHNYHDVWSALDDVCLSRISDWTKQTRYLFADLWYRLHLVKLSDFMHWFIDYYQQHVKHATRDDFVFIMHMLRIDIRHEMIFRVEDTLNCFAPELSLDELTVVAASLRSRQKKVRLDASFHAIVNKLKAEASHASDINVKRILELLRYSTSLTFMDQLLDLSTRLVPEIDRLSIMSCVHLALLGTTLQFFHEESLQKISHKLIADINDVTKVRIKDMERLLIALNMFNYNPKTHPDVFEAIFEELHKPSRRPEFFQHERCVLSILNLLSMHKMYSYELMNELLDMTRIFELYGKSPKMGKRELFNLDVSIDVDCPDYLGNRLDKTYREKGVRYFVEWIPRWNQQQKLRNAEKFFLSVVDSVEEAVGGMQNVHINHLLPSYVKPSIVVCKDKSGNFVKPPDLERYVLGDVMRPTDPNIKWLVIIPVNWNSVIKNVKRNLGVIVNLERQLSVIGYEPVILDYRDVPIHKEQRLEYIKTRLS